MSSAVPLEILQAVFLLHRDLTQGYREAESSTHRDERVLKRGAGYQWIAVSHVCRRWRAAAVDCPPLWTHVAVTCNTKWMSEVLGRSGAMPLRVTAELGATEGHRSRAFRVVLADLHRIKSLYLSGQIDHETVLLLSNSAPSLERLVLDHVTLPSPADTKHRDDNYTYFPCFLQREQTPRLAHLELDGFRPQLRGPCADTLTRLVFRHRVAGSLMGRRYSGPCLRSLLDALQNMPALESVAFDKEAHVMLGPAAEAELLSSLPDVALPRLRSLHVHATAEESVALLDHLALPALSDLTLSCARNCAEYPATLPASLARALSAVPETHALHLAWFTGSGSHRYVRFTGYAAPRASQATFDVMVDRGYGRAEILPIMSRGLPLPAVRELTIDSQEGLEEAVWGAILDALPNLTSVSVVGRFAQHRLEEVRACLEHIKGVESEVHAASGELQTARRLPVLRAGN